MSATAKCASEIMPRIGTVEGFIANWKVGNDVAVNGSFQQRPLEPGRISRMAARNPAFRQSDPDEYIASESFNDGHALSRTINRRNSCVEFFRRQCREPGPQQANALLYFADADPDAGIHVSVLQHRHVKGGADIRGIWNI